MNLTTLLSDYGVTAIVVLVWLSLYFILVVWTFVYRYLVLNIALNNEKKCLEVLLSGRNALPKNSLLGSNLIGIDKKLTEPMLQYSLDKAIKDATIGLTFLGIVASTAPFIGLFGTVVEILEAFSKLGTNSKATLDVIAPVISKALVATAAGILTAVPAYSFNLFLKRKVFELNTYLQLQINVLISPKQIYKLIGQEVKTHYNWDETPDLNITPLVDIMLVLLAILMVTAPVIVYQEEIALPQGSKSAKMQEDSKIEIRMDLKRNIYLKDDILTFDSFPDAFIMFANAYDKNTQVYIRADKNLKYDDVIYVLKIAKQTGFTRVSLVTDG